MPHFPKPFFRASHGLWYVQIAGQQHNLGPDEDATFTAYHALMSKSVAKAVVTAESVVAVAISVDGHSCRGMERSLWVQVAFRASPATPTSTPRRFLSWWRGTAVISGGASAGRRRLDFVSLISGWLAKASAPRSDAGSCSETGRR